MLSDNNEIRFSVRGNLLCASDGREFVLPEIPEHYRRIGPWYIKQNPVSFYFFLWPLHEECPRLRCDVAIYEKQTRYPTKIISDIDFTERDFIPG